MFNIGIKVAFHVPATTMQNTAAIASRVTAILEKSNTPNVIAAPKKDDAIT